MSLAAVLAAVAGGAFLLRLGTRLWLTDASSVDEGYSFYLDIARTFVDGGGLCPAPGDGCSQRVPVYPLLLAPLVASGWLYPGLAIVQSLIGALTVWLAAAIARDLFGPRAALLTAVLAAINPYAVVHDTALQETSLVNGLLVLSLYLLLGARCEISRWRVLSANSPTGCSAKSSDHGPRLRARRGGPVRGHPRALISQPTLGLRSSDRRVWAIAGGAALGLAVLTTARVALLVPAVLMWAAFATSAPWRERIRRAALVAVPIVILVGGWMLRNWRLEGAPVLTTETGVSLWLGNNPRTFDRFPKESIDRVAADSFGRATPQQWADIRATIGKPVERDRLLRGWARDAVSADPVMTAANAARKIWVVLSARYTPERSALVQWGYLAFFLPVHLLSAWTLWHTWRRDDAHLLTIGVLAAFLVTTAAFWAHTSHKSLVDALLFVYASAGLTDMRASTA